MLRRALINTVLFEEKTLQCVSRIWASLTWLKFMIMVWLQAPATFKPKLFNMMIKIMTLNRLSKSVIHTVEVKKKTKNLTKIDSTDGGG